jgi:serine/threonine protein kinase
MGNTQMEIENVEMSLMDTSIYLPLMRTFINDSPWKKSQGSKIYKAKYSKNDESRICVAKWITTKEPSEYEKTCELLHENILNPLGVYKGEKYIVFYDFIENGTLSSFVKEQSELSESHCKVLFKKMISAIAYLHKNNIIHHDIKLENFLMKDDFTPMLIDFESSRKLIGNKVCKYIFGSPFYMAPEIYRHKTHKYEIDIWSLGVCLYFMLFSKYPYSGKTKEEIGNKVVNQEFEIPDIKVSLSVKKLIYDMLEKNQDIRISSMFLEKHKWFKFDEQNILYKIEFKKKISYREEQEKISHSV